MKVISVILITLASLLLFGVVFYVSLLLLTLFIGILLNIGFVNALLSWMTDGFIEYPIYLISSSLAYLSIKALLGLFDRRHRSEALLSKRILGITILGFNLIFIILNLMTGASILTNIVVCILGVVFIVKSKSSVAFVGANASMVSNPSEANLYPPTPRDDFDATNSSENEIEIIEVIRWARALSQGGESAIDSFIDSSLRQEAKDAASVACVVCGILSFHRSEIHHHPDFCDFDDAFPLDELDKMILDRAVHLCFDQILAGQLPLPDCSAEDSDRLAALLIIQVAIREAFESGALHDGVGQICRFGAYFTRLYALSCEILVDRGFVDIPDSAELTKRLHGSIGYGASVAKALSMEVT